MWFYLNVLHFQNPAVVARFSPIVNYNGKTERCKSLRMNKPQLFGLRMVYSTQQQSTESGRKSEAVFCDAPALVRLFFAH